MNHPSSTPRMFALVISEWLLVLPAAVFFAAAALRLLQPPQYEPARTSWLIFEWTTAHISRAGAAALFLGLPGVVVLAGCLALLRRWRQDNSLRQDVAAMLAGLRRYAVIALMTMATLLAGSILTVSVVHIIMD